MPLSKGPSTIRKNVTELMQPALSGARKKAIHTIAKKHNIALKDAQFKQAVAISRSLARRIV